MINLSKKCDIVTRSSTLKNSFCERKKRKKHVNVIETGRKMFEKDKWESLFEAADIEIKAKIANLLRVKRHEDELKARFDYQAELFRKSPVRSRSHLDKYRAILNISSSKPRLKSPYFRSKSPVFPSNPC